MTRRDYAVVTIGSTRLETWQSYELVSDLTVAADAWSLSMPLAGTYEQRRELMRRVREGVRVSIYVAAEPDAGPSIEALQVTGIVDKVSGTGARQGATLRLQGRDNGGLLASASVDPRLAITSETTLVRMVEQMVEPFGMTVITEPVLARELLTGLSQSETAARLARQRARAAGTHGSTSSARARRGRGGLIGADVQRVPMREARPHVGETVWEFIDRHCRRFGVMPWIDPRGRLILGAPDYDQEPLFRLRRVLGGDGNEPNNILEGGFTEGWSELASEVTVYGRSHGSDASRSRFVGHATNPLVHVYRPVVLQDASCLSSEEAQRRAEAEIGAQKEEAFSLEYEVAHHGQGSRLYAVDTVIDVLDEEVGIEGLFYCAARTFTASRKEGAKTRLRLVPLGAITV